MYVTSLTITGSGTFVASNASRSITISKDKIVNLIELGFVASFNQTNEHIKEVVQQVINKRYFDQLLNYNDSNGFPHPKTAAINWMKTFGMAADQEQVAIVSGAQNALAIALTALFEPGNKIATDFYTYSNFIGLAKIFRIQLVPFLGDQLDMIPDELDKQCSQVNIHGIFLMPSCNNPTSIMMSDFRKQELAKVIKKYRLILIEDDIHAFLTAGIVSDYQQPMFHLLPEQTVYISGSSKSICSRLRVTYMVYGDTFRTKVLRSIFNINVKTSSLDAEIITELILSGKAHEIVSLKNILRKKQTICISNISHRVKMGNIPLVFIAGCLSKISRIQFN